jgi:flagellar hook-length control protein FliK
VNTLGGMEMFSPLSSRGIAPQPGTKPEKAQAGKGNADGEVQTTSFAEGKSGQGFSKTLESAVGNDSKPVTQPEVPKEERDVEIAEKVNKAFDATQKSKVTVPQSHYQPELLKEDRLPVVGQQSFESQVKPAQKPIFKFMDSMESELGVGPERLLAAMASLNDTELNQSPEHTQGQFVENLELPPVQHQRATELYSGMLDELGEIEMQHKVAGGDKVLNLEVLSPEEMHLRHRDDGITKMQDNFFVKHQLPTRNQDIMQPMTERLQSELPQGRAEATQTQEKPFFMPTQTNPMQAAQSEKGAEASRFTPGLMGMESVTPKTMASEVSTPNYGSTEQTISQLANYQKSMQQESGLANQGYSEQFTGQSQQTISGQAQSATQEMEELLAKMTAGDGMDTAMAEEVDGEENTLKNDRFMGQLSKGETVKSFQVNSKVIDQPIGKAEETANANEVIERAQLFIKRGGGEMKIRMHPEELGQVELKVDVRNGDVNVQMVTETAEAKRILERGLNELRMNLGQQKLNVDMVKVDVSDQMDTNDSHKQDFSESRDQARSFMNAFRQEQEDLRQGFFQVPGFESRSGISSKVRDMQPQDLDEPRRPQDGQRKLDLVA